MTSSSSAASATVRAIGPVCASDAQDGGEKPGERGTKPKVGLMPTTPQNDDGTRIEPTPSVPIASGTATRRDSRRSTAAGSAAGAVGFQGLRVMPETGLSAVSL